MDRYSVFFEKTFGSEGYHQTDPNDKGNYYKGKLYGTICGITARDHFKEYQDALYLFEKHSFQLLKEYCMKFYMKKGYWNVLYEDISDVSLSFKIWDFGVNSGVGNAVKLLQNILVNYWGYKINQDGNFGAITLAATNKAFIHPPRIKNNNVKMIVDESIEYAYYIWRLDLYYHSLKNFWYWGTGWIRRLKFIMNKMPDKVPELING